MNDDRKSNITLMAVVKNETIASLSLTVEQSKLVCVLSLLFMIV